MRLLSTMCLGLLIALAAFSTEVLAHAGPDLGFTAYQQVVTLDHMDYHAVAQTDLTTVVKTYAFSEMSRNVQQPTGASTRSHASEVVPMQPPSWSFNRAHLLNGNRHLGVRLYATLPSVTNS